MKIRVYGDLAQENRRSMDICGHNLTTALTAKVGQDVEYYVSPFRRYLSGVVDHPLSAKLDLLVNRHFSYKLPTELVDIHHVIDHSYGHLLYRLPLANTVITCHDLNILYRAQETKNPLLRASCQHILRGLARAKWVICDSEFTRQELDQSALTPEAKIKVIPLGLDAIFQVLPAHKLIAIEQQYQLPSGPRLIHVGTCFERKNIETLLHILAQVRQSYPVHLLKVGGEFTEGQLNIIRELNLQDYILHLTNVPLADLVGLYNCADICVFPSWLEGFGFPVLEAMACGTPVVATQRSSVPELVGTAGILADPAHAASFVEPIIQLLEDPGLQENLRQKALLWVQNFSWDAHATKTLAFYQTVLSA